MSKIQISPKQIQNFVNKHKGQLNLEEDNEQKTTIQTYYQYINEQLFQYRKEEFPFYLLVIIQGQKVVSMNNRQETSLNQSRLIENKRSSIINSLYVDKSVDRLDKVERSSDKPIEKVKKSINRIKKCFQQQSFQPFDLSELQQNYMLIKRNPKFSKMLDLLRIYNKKLFQKREPDIVNYHLYSFFYSTLRICNTKTQSEVDFYLKEVYDWFHNYKNKRELFFHHNKKNKILKNDQDIIRQTFKSNLPLQINQYNRKVFTFSAPKQKKIGRNLNVNHKKLNSTLFTKFHDNSDGQNDDQIIKKIKDSHHNQKKKNEMELPNLRAYKMQVLRMRKVVEQRQDQKIYESLKKNQSRIKTQSSNNFYKALRNRNDIFNKTIPNSSQLGEKLKKQYEEGIKRKTREPAQINADDQLEGIEQEQNKENYHVIVNSTSAGFYQIKKRNLNIQLGQKNSFNQSSFPKFFTTSEGYPHGTSQQKYGEEGAQTKQGQAKQHIISNISGLSLIKNPFEITKSKKQKKAK